MTTSRRTRRRLSLAMLVTLAIVGVFLVRLVDIQVVRASELNIDSLEKRAVPTVTYAARGDVVDKNGVVLAGSIMRYDVTVSPKVIAGLRSPAFARGSGDDEVQVSFAQAASEVADVTGQTQNQVLLTFTGDPTSDFEYVAKKVTLEQMRKIRDLKIPGIYSESHPARIYPGGAVAGNLVGFVGTDGPQNGLEWSEDECLTSTNGSSTYERGADGIRLPGSTVTSQEPIPGGTVTTTIDYDLNYAIQQMIAEQAISIGAQSAMAGVIEIKTGKLLAMADYPSVDPNNVDATPADYLGALTFSAAYEPGSIFKPMTAAMLLDQGVADAGSRVNVPARWTSPEGSVVRDAAAHADQRLTLAGVIEQSSNVGISQLAVRLSNKTRYGYMTAFGLGQSTEVGFQGESDGLLAGSWDDQQKYDVAYGQGVTASVAQLLSIYQTLGNNGMRLPVTLVTGCTKADGTVTELPTGPSRAVVSEAAADKVVQMMEGVVTGGGLAAQLQIPGYRVGAKSGTAQVAANGRYTSDRVVSIAGLAPAEDPQYAVVVMFVKPSTMKTSAAAAPTFKKIMTKVLATYRVTPSTTPSPLLPTTW